MTLAQDLEDTKMTKHRASLNKSKRIHEANIKDLKRIIARSEKAFSYSIVAHLLRCALVLSSRFIKDINAQIRNPRFVAKRPKKGVLNALH